MTSPKTSDGTARRTSDLVCIGGAAINRKYHAKGALIAGTSNPATTNQSFGGVARNVAETLARLQKAVALVSLVGEDEAGRAIFHHLSELGVDVGQVAVSPMSATAEYAAILDGTGDLHIAMAAMDALEAITPAMLVSAWPHIAASRWIFADCNLPEATLHALLQGKAGAKLAVNTVSVPKAVRLPDDLSAIDVLFTNAGEAKAMLGINTNAPSDLTTGLRQRGANAVVLTLGADGHLVADDTGTHQVKALDAHTVDVTGAGDALMSGTLYGLMNGQSLVDASRLGAVLATFTLESEQDVLPDLTPAWLESQTDRLARITSRKLPIS
ncbi:MAG: carbohydrate kinase family protein [Rhizobiales bacterium]|nr:carbohydrate kinase family protein [Hyphomicrobiales bacterium]MBO6697314.1 carbohydrate kinase family protein [Hyphomicrobiales bacterium]MBO6736431.1 carbohydrate kinase family protein [Hyphomicrobiales bacterium]MBO6912901.1 carbohydrate kinase family protein [Hyphomicrobiales bacterium]MBO6954069.1 carbohydrate kinase family protein [Hyphomicrobiales bacterium]